MGAGKNKVHRKKRISKHVRQAQERRLEKGDETKESIEASSVPTQSAEKKKVNSKNNKNIKDPSEAASYLSTWKHRNAGVDVWKFNKNTQSWLIRHMYDATTVPKSTFEVLIEYLKSGGEGLRSRVQEDATRRALRYKDYEKNLESRRENEAVENKEASAEKNESKETEDAKDEAERWKALSDHDKRKEYKRARKILDLFKDEK